MYLHICPVVTLDDAAEVVTRGATPDTLADAYELVRDLDPDQLAPDLGDRFVALCRALATVDGATDAEVREMGDELLALAGDVRRAMDPFADLPSLAATAA